MTSLARNKTLLRRGESVKSQEIAFIALSMSTYAVNRSQFDSFKTEFDSKYSG